MDENLISGKRYLFAYCITDGAFDDWSEERRTAMIIDITKIKEALLKDYQSTESDRKNTKKVSKKYQNNEGCQNKAKVSK